MAETEEHEEVEKIEQRDDITTIQVISDVDRRMENQESSSLLNEWITSR